MIIFCICSFLNVLQPNLPVRRGAVGEFVALERLFPGEGAATAFLEAHPMAAGTGNANTSSQPQEGVRRFRATFGAVAGQGVVRPESVGRRMVMMPPVSSSSSSSRGYPYDLPQDAAAPANPLPPPTRHYRHRLYR